MLSKFLKPRNRLHILLGFPKVPSYGPPVKHLVGVPKPPYDTAPRRRPNKFNLGYALRVHWELWPLVIVTAAVVVFSSAFCVWTSQNKVDVVYTRGGSNISRTMDLCHPTVHKLYTIDQRYEPWPEMVAVLMKMKDAQNRLDEEKKRTNTN